MIRIPKKSLLLIGILVLVVAVPTTLLGIRFFASNPLACKTCHLDIYAMWEESLVHPKAESECQDCHAQNKYQLKPVYLSDQDTVSSNCESCHEDIFEKTEVEKVKLIKISHKIHLNENLNCVECHRNVTHDRVNPSTYRPRKESCLRCHLREIEGSLEDEACMMCHYIILDQSTSLIFNPFPKNYKQFN
jgi:nitrate/TMAO reductase-like tetraheme cytochrome c subunit